MSRQQRKRTIRLVQSRRRWLHDLKRKEKKEDALARALMSAPDFREEIRRGYQSAPLRLMAAKCSETLPSDAVVAGKMVAPRIFSLHENPQETLRTIFRIAKYAQSQRSQLRVSIDLGGVKKMDLAADSLLGIVLKEIKNECFGVRRAVIRGSYPRSEELRTEMTEVGTVKVLMSRPGQDNVELSFNEDIRVYRHRETGTEITRTYDASATVETVTGEFANHVNRCLNTIGLELNEIGLKNLCKYIGELLANAQEHAGITDWTIIGYLDTKSKVFKFSVINFGKSIEDTFTDLDPDSYTWKQIESYVYRHQNSALRKFGMRRGSLITVAALQGKVSSKNFTNENTRGQGTVAMIEFFQNIYDHCKGEGAVPAEMTLISGSTHISFDGRYRISQVASNRELIAFNANNDMNELPDGKVVRSMPGVSFPGTIITINFPLTERLQIREVEA